MISWEMLAAPGDAEPGWLSEVREFRARVLYDDGRRPGFRQDDGRYVDDDRLDKVAHHVVVRIDGMVAGCVRLLPVSNDAMCLTEQLIGIDRFADMLQALRACRGESIEGGRWVVDPTYRVLGLGRSLAAGGVAVARALRARLLFCPVGIGGKQDRVLARLGLAAVPNLPLIGAPQFDDELRLMYVCPNRLTPHFRELVDGMECRLRLVSTTQVKEDASAVFGEGTAVGSVPVFRPASALVDLAGPGYSDTGERRSVRPGAS
jgi:hypothetical protein